MELQVYAEVDGHSFEPRCNDDSELVRSESIETLVVHSFMRQRTYGSVLVHTCSFETKEVLAN